MPREPYTDEELHRAEYPDFDYLDKDTTDAYAPGSTFEIDGELFDANTGEKVKKGAPAKEK